jgi:hypothetical protein
MVISFPTKQTCHGAVGQLRIHLCLLSETLFLHWQAGVHIKVQIIQTLPGPFELVLFFAHLYHTFKVHLHIFCMCVCACVRACVLAVRAMSGEDLHMSVPVIASTLLPAAQEASKNVHKLVQETGTERKVKCVWVALFNPLKTKCRPLYLNKDPFRTAL